MTSGRKRRAWADPMQDAVWEWAADVGTEYGYAVQVSLRPTRRPGVWGIVVRALHVVDGRPGGIVAQVSREWPDATYTAFWASVLGATAQLTTLLEQDALTRKRESA